MYECQSSTLIFFSSPSRCIENLLLFLHAHHLFQFAIIAVVVVVVVVVVCMISSVSFCHVFALGNGAKANRMIWAVLQGTGRSVPGCDRIQKNCFLSCWFVRWDQESTSVPDPRYLCRRRTTGISTTGLCMTPPSGGGASCRYICRSRSMSCHSLGWFSGGRPLGMRGGGRICSRKIGCSSRIIVVLRLWFLLQYHQSGPLRHGIYNLLPSLLLLRLRHYDSSSYRSRHCFCCYIHRYCPRNPPVVVVFLAVVVVLLVSITCLLLGECRRYFIFYVCGNLTVLFFWVP